jgi:hypothetical protein
MSSAIISFIVIGIIILVIRFAFFAPTYFKMNHIVKRTKSLAEVIDKAQHLARLFKSKIDNSKLSINTEKYFCYYLGYFDSCVKSVSEYDGVTYDDSVRTAIYIEAYKIKENPPESHEFSSENVEEGKALLGKALQSEYGIQGAKDGKSDGDYCNNPSNPAPYFQRIVDYFNS